MGILRLFNVARQFSSSNATLTLQLTWGEYGGGKADYTCTYEIYTNGTLFATVSAGQILDTSYTYNCVTGDSFTVRCTISARWIAGGSCDVTQGAVVTSSGTTNMQTYECSFIIADSIASVTVACAAPDRDA